MYSSASVAKQSNSQGAAGSGTGCMSCCCNVFAAVVVFDVDHRFFLVLCRWPFIVAGVSWRCVVTGFLSIPGMPRS